MEQMNLKKLLPKAAAVAVVGGILAVLLSAIFNPLKAALPVGWGGIVITAVILVLLTTVVAKLARRSSIARLSLYEFIVLLGTVSLVGQIISLVVPQVSDFILDVGSFTVSGLLSLFLYIALVSLIFSYVGGKEAKTVTV